MKKQRLTYTISQLNYLRTDLRIMIDFNFYLEVNRWRNRKQIKQRCKNKNNNSGKQFKHSRKEKDFENRHINREGYFPILNDPNYLTRQHYYLHNEKRANRIEQAPLRNNYQHKSQVDCLFPKPKFDLDVVSFRNTNWKNDSQVKHNFNTESILNSKKNNISKKELVNISDHNYPKPKDMHFETSFYAKNSYMLSSDPNNPFSIYGFYPTNIITPEINKEYNVSEDDSDNLSSSFDNFTIVIHVDSK